MAARSALAAAFFSLATAAGAVPIDSVGDSFSVSFDGNIGCQDVEGLTASATFVVSQFDAAAGRVVLQISLDNTSDEDLWQSARVSALGFDVSESLASASASGLFQYALTDGKFPNQFGPVDVCVVDNRNTCSGGRWGGVRLGKDGSITLTLAFSGPITSLELSNFGVRYQSLSSCELGILGASGTGTGTVPEPRALALLGAAGLALYGRRRQRA
jgi:hypothetical protein